MFLKIACYLLQLHLIGACFAWILYLVDKKIMIQQRTFLPGYDVKYADFNLEGDFYKYIGQRETHSEGQKISEWAIDLKDLEDFANKVKACK